TCVKFYTNPANLYTFGQPPDLNHNLEEIRDESGRVVLENFYGGNPGGIDFDKVQIQRFNGGSILFQYHDLVLEDQYCSTPAPPSVPDNERVQKRKDFVSHYICPSLDCSHGCSEVQNETAQTGHQQPVSATTITDGYSVKVRYFDRVGN